MCGKNKCVKKMIKTFVSSRLLHFKQPAGTSRGVYTTHLSYYVTLEKNGVRGVGECSVLPDLSCDAMPTDRYEACCARRANGWSKQMAFLMRC